jgi:hypothetical protein
MGLVLSKFSFGEDDYNPTFQPGISYKPICTTYRTHSVYCLFTSFTSTEVHFLALFVQKHKYWCLKDCRPLLTLLALLVAVLTLLALLAHKYTFWRKSFDLIYEYKGTHSDAIRVCGRPFQLTYADVCGRMRTYADWRMLTHADVCWRVLTYANVCWCMLTYADACGRMQGSSA